MASTIWIMVLTLLLSACARLPQHLPGGKMAQRTEFSRTLARYAGHSGIVAGAWPQAAWWKSARSPVLNALMARALHNNPSLRLATARIIAARAAASGRRAALLPHFSAGTSVTQEYFSAQGLHTTANGSSVLYTELNPLEVQYQVDLWGRDSDQLRAALGAVRVARADRAEARLLLSTRIAVHYFGLAGDIQRRKKIQQVEHLSRALLDLDRQRLRSGLISAQVVYRQQEACSAARQFVAGIDASVRLQRHILAALAGHGPDWGQRIQAGSLPSFSLFAMPENVPLRIAARRPDLVAARWEIEVAARKVGAARAAFYPDVNIALFAGWNSIHLGDLLNPGNLAHAVGPVITLPIFEGGALRAQLKEKNALYMATEYHYRSTILNAVRQIADRLAQWQRIRRQLSAQQDTTIAAGKTTRLEYTAFHAGISDGARLLSARIIAAEAQTRLIALQTANAEAWALLNAALGGGYGGGGIHP